MKKNKGYSLIELIVIIGLLALVAGIFLVNMLGKDKKDRTEKITEKDSGYLYAAYAIRYEKK